MGNERRSVSTHAHYDSAVRVRQGLTWHAGEVRACAILGKRYVDLTGEPHFVRKIIEL